MRPFYQGENGSALIDQNVLFFVPGRLGIGNELWLFRFHLPNPILAGLPPHRGWSYFMDRETVPQLLAVHTGSSVNE